MTHQDALRKAETQVYVNMNKEEVGYYFQYFNLQVINRAGRVKHHPRQLDMERALVNHIATALEESPEGESADGSNLFQI